MRTAAHVEGQAAKLGVNEFAPLSRLRLTAVEPKR
jgi:hypothetical protein